MDSRIVLTNCPPLAPGILSARCFHCSTVGSNPLAKIRSPFLPILCPFSIFLQPSLLRTEVRMGSVLHHFQRPAVRAWWKSLMGCDGSRNGKDDKEREGRGGRGVRWGKRYSSTSDIRSRTLSKERRNGGDRDGRNKLVPLLGRHIPSMVQCSSTLTQLMAEKAPPIGTCNYISTAMGVAGVHAAAARKCISKRFLLLVKGGKCTSI